MVLFGSYVLHRGDEVPLLFFLSGAFLSCIGLWVRSRGGRPSEDADPERSNTKQTMLWLPANGWQQQRSETFRRSGWRNIRNWLHRWSWRRKRSVGRHRPRDGTLLCLGLAVLLGCENNRLGPNTRGPFRATVVASRPTAVDEERFARSLAPCPPVTVDPGWSLQRDPEARIEWRLASDYRAVSPPAVGEHAEWLAPDSSRISLSFHDATWTSAVGFGYDSPTTVVDEGSCSLSFAGRRTSVARFQVAASHVDTFYFAAVDKIVRPNFAVAAQIFAPTSSRRDHFLASLTTFQVIRNH
jgi:hypothetical protein